MIEVIFRLFGGIGLFLVGMLLLSDGLTAFAGDALRRALLRFTGTPVKAFASGAITTLVVQSSTATTVTLIGFVSAGLITFPQAIGVVMGASLGTTATGWVVAGLGLKISLGTYTLPLVGLGAFLKLLGHGRTRSLGMALAGFGMIFIGLDFLQSGMQGVSGRFNLAALPVGGLGAHLAIMLVGVLMTAIMQSSTAAVATTLTALHTGTVNLEQAAALVVGAAVGTTLTGALAAIGGSVSAKRTALTHVLFNLATGLIAILLLPIYLMVIQRLQAYLGASGNALSLAAFHTSFIAVGVLLFLPQAERISRLIERLLPERQPSASRHLDASLLTVPSVALQVAHRSLLEIAHTLLIAFDSVLRGQRGPEYEHKLAASAQSLSRVQEFLARIPSQSDINGLLPQRVAMLHAMDHLLRFQGRLEAPRVVVSALTDDESQKALACARELAMSGQALFKSSAEALRDDLLPDVAVEMRAEGESLLATAQERVEWTQRGYEHEADVGDRMAHAAQTLTDLLESARRTILEQMAMGERTTEEALQVTDGLRWLERSGHHIWRSFHYLQEAALPQPAPASPRTEPEEVAAEPEVAVVDAARV